MALLTTMIKRRPKKLLLLLTLGALCHTAKPILAQSEQANLAAFVLNIVRFSTWPTEIKNSINVCVVGDDVVQQSFVSIDQKTVGIRTLQISNVSRWRDVKSCHVLYLSAVKQNILLQVFAELKQQPLLTIGEGYEFAAQGGMIGLETVGSKITLHINLPVVHEAGLNISARVLNLAHIIGQ